MEDPKIAYAQEDMIASTMVQLKEFHKVGLMNLVNMQIFYNYENVVKFNYSQYHQNKLWLDKLYEIIEEVMEWITKLKQARVDHSHLMQKRSWIKAKTIEHLMGVKINTKVMDIGLIMIHSI